MSASITRRLLISNLAILCAFLGLAGVALDRAFRASTESALREQLQAHVYTLLTAATEDAAGAMRMPSMLTAPAFNRPDSGLYAEVVGDAGRYRWRSGSLVGRSEPLTQAVDVGDTRYRDISDLKLLDQGVSWEDNTGRPIRYTLTVAVSRAAMDAEQASFRAALWRWLGGVTLVLLVAQILSARWGLAPLRHMANALQRIENGAADRIEGDVPRELQGLSDNLNALIEHNRTRQERVRHSLADLAHSMKTPLAVLQGLAEQQGGELRRQITEQSGRIDEIVSYQRQRAAVAGGSGVTRPIALRPIAARVCASLDKVHRERGLQCELRIDDRLQLRIDEGDLFELLGNLLENAYKHCRSRVMVSTSAGRDGSILLTIEDDGPGIPSHDRRRLLRRGERADQRHPGEGIGLAVTNEIVHQYGGELGLLESQLGGTCVRLRLPGSGAR